MQYHQYKKKCHFHFCRVRVMVVCMCMCGGSAVWQLCQGMRCVCVCVCVCDCMHAWPLVLTDLRCTIFSFFFTSVQLGETSVPVPQTGIVTIMLSLWLILQIIGVRLLVRCVCVYVVKSCSWSKKSCVIERGHTAPGLVQAVRQRAKHKHDRLTTIFVP